MKSKFLLSIVWLLTASISVGQTSVDSLPSVRKNDVLIDPIYLIAISVLNLSYEHLVNADFGIGVHGLFGLEEMEGISQVSPYARMYFGKNYASGFFLETFVPVTSSQETITEYDSYMGTFIESKDERHTTVGAGIGLGGKWVLKRNIIFELGGGVARRFSYKGSGEPLLVNGC